MASTTCSSWELDKGVHYVFYAADLLKLSNGSTRRSHSWASRPSRVTTPWSEGAIAPCFVTRPRGKTAGDRDLSQAIPHVRHVTEFGAVCTACHSAEVHKAVTAKAATCTGCHHSPQNERCECHRGQSAFYRGQVRPLGVRVEPNVMAEAVGCTGCHDWSHKHSRRAGGGAVRWLPRRRLHQLRGRVDDRARQAGGRGPGGAPERGDRGGPRAAGWTPHPRGLGARAAGPGGTRPRPEGARRPQSGRRRGGPRGGPGESRRGHGPCPPEVAQAPEVGPPEE